MATIGFGICLGLSILIIIYMAAKNYETINTYYWSIIILVPIVVLAYWLKTRVSTPEGARVTLCFIYLDSTILLILVLFSMLYAMHVNISPAIKLAGYTAAFIHAGVVWGCFNNDLYYATVEIVESPLGSATNMTSGPLKIVHLIYLAIMVISVVSALIYSAFQKGNYSRRTLFLYAAFTVSALLIYLMELGMGLKYSLLPYLYVLADFVIAVDYDRTRAHEIESLIAEQEKHSSSIGYFAVDGRGLFLSCSSRAYDFLPEMRDFAVDKSLPEGTRCAAGILDMIHAYESSGKTSHKFSMGDMTCVCEISEFKRKIGSSIKVFLFSLRDATEEQRALDVISSYNDTLNAEIEEKTRNIKDIQRKVVIGMANIIENRDDNTGGHVKRTSDIIGIIADEILKQGTMDISETFARDIVRAAPMHDLGKISIDSSVLLKPGRLTAEEYGIMKTHSSKSGEMVRILLDGVEEERFVDIAYNIARYHHERWDGNGYPEGLVGTMIPLEARIMAIADVYDALVSKRCYKEPMSFDAAKNIMCEGMGTQFDPNMKKVFLGCREKLEEYYANN